jgi:hypothetical protein
VQRIGELMHRLLVELAPTYATDKTYQMLQRVFHEQFVLTEETLQGKSDDAAGGPPPEMLSVSDLVAEPDEPAEISAVATQPDVATRICAASAVPDPAAEIAVAAAPLDAAPEPGTPQMTPTIQPKPGKEISANSLLSPDDPEATFRRKGNQTYQGYVTNVTETCDPENPFQLIVQVQTSPNTTQDAALLVDALADLKLRTGVDILHNDAAFCSPAADRVLREHHVTQVPTGLCGHAPNPARLGLADFQVQSNPEGVPQQMTCPKGQCVPVILGRQSQWYGARFDRVVCQACSLQTRCPSQVSKSNTWRTLRFSQRQHDVAQRRQRSAAYHQAGKNLRAAIEATIGALKRPFSDDQLPVRGRYRVGVMMIGSAVMVNVRRIQRCLVEKDVRQQQTQQPTETKEPQRTSLSSFLSALWTRLSERLWLAASRPRTFALEH